MSWAVLVQRNGFVEFLVPVLDPGADVGFEGIDTAGVVAGRMSCSVRFMHRLGRHHPAEAEAEYNAHHQIGQHTHHR